jgi:hypothetical protein
MKRNAFAPAARWRRFPVARNASTKAIAHQPLSSKYVLTDRRFVPRR